MARLTYAGALELLKQGDKILRVNPTSTGEFVETGDRVSIHTMNVLIETDAVMVESKTPKGNIYMLRPPSAADRVIQETVFRTTDQRVWPDMETAVTVQREIDFRTWCQDNICRGGEWTAGMVAQEILGHWKMEPKE